MKKQKLFTLPLLIIFICLVSIIFLKEKRIKEIKDIQIISLCGIYDKAEMQIGKNIVHVEIADTDCKRKLGLSGRESLGIDDGMLFLFDKDSYYSFWMKDMNFAIDIIWINSDFIVTGIEKNIKPDTYPEVYGEKYLTQYVTELPSGYSDAHNVKVGDKIIFSVKKI